MSEHSASITNQLIALAASSSSSGEPLLRSALARIEQAGYQAACQIPGGPLLRTQRYPAVEHAPSTALSVGDGWADVADGSHALRSQLGLLLAIATNETSARHQAMLACLQTISEVAASANDLETLLNTIYVQTTELLGLDRFVASVYDETRGQMLLTQIYNRGERQPDRWVTFDPENSLLAWMIANRQSLLFQDSEVEPLPVKPQPFIGSQQHESRAWAGVPMIASGQVLGALSIQSFDVGVFDEEDLRVLTQIAQQAALAIISLRSRSEIRHQLDELHSRQRELELSYEQQGALLDTIRDLSVPVVPLLEGVVALPLVGNIDSRRASQILEDLLASVVAQRVSVVLLDITGVPVVDTSVANYLLHAVRAVELLGARCIIVGIRPEVAQTIVGIGINLQTVVTLANLQEGVRYALGLQGLRLVQV